MNNARINRMVREIEADPAFQLFETLFAALEGAVARASRIFARRRHVIPALAD